MKSKDSEQMRRRVTVTLPHAMTHDLNEFLHHPFELDAKRRGILLTVKAYQNLVQMADFADEMSRSHALLLVAISMLSKKIENLEAEKAKDERNKNTIEDIQKAHYNTLRDKEKEIEACEEMLKHEKANVIFEQRENNQLWDKMRIEREKYENKLNAWRAETKKVLKDHNLEHLSRDLSWL